MFSRHGRERANTLHNQMPDLCLPSLPPPRNPDSLRA